MNRKPTIKKYGLPKAYSGFKLLSYIDVVKDNRNNENIKRRTKNQ